MKNTLLGFLLAVVLIIGTAATTVNIMTVKPAMPKSILTFSNGRCDGDIIAEKIKYYASKGYVFKQGIGSDCKVIIVMEKY